MDTTAVTVRVGDSRALQRTLQTQAYTATLPSDTNPASATILVYEEGRDTTGTVDAGSSATQVKDAARAETASFWVGMELEFTSGTNAGEKRKITAFTATTVPMGTLTLDVTNDPLPATPAAGDTYLIRGYPIVYEQDLDGHASGILSGAAASWQLTAVNGCTATARILRVVIAATFTNGSFTDVVSAQWRVSVEG